MFLRVNNMIFWLQPHSSKTFCALQPVIHDVEKLNDYIHCIIHGILVTLLSNTKPYLVHAICEGLLQYMHSSI